jgi:hypothetical protein
MLPLSEFIAIVGGTSHDKLASVVDDIAPRLPGVFTRLLDDPQLENLLESNPYTAREPASVSVQYWAKKHANAWSLDRGRIVQRLQLSTLRSPADVPQPRPLSKVAAVGAGEELCQHYALYQLALLHSLADRPDHAFRVELIARSNRLN